MYRERGICCVYVMCVVVYVYVSCYVLVYCSRPLGVEGGTPEAKTHHGGRGRRGRGGGVRPEVKGEKHLGGAKRRSKGSAPEAKKRTSRVEGEGGTRGRRGRSRGKGSQRRCVYLVSCYIQ